MYRNKTKHFYPEDKVLYELFEEQVEKTPDSIAVVFENQQLTYQELNRRANRLAHYLRAYYKTKFNQVLFPDTLIALCLDRGLEMIISILGILKAGAAYVPLDPGHPADRLRCILQDTKAKIVITNAVYLQSLQQINMKSDVLNDTTNLGTHKGFIRDKQIEMLAIDCPDLDKQLKGLPIKNTSIITTSKNLAYVMYTSGTTGTPKGVMITHKAIISRIFYLIKEHGVNSLFNIASKIPYIFDPSVREIFLSLLSGARLVIFSEEVNQNTDKLINLCSKSSIHLLIFVPSHLSIFLTNMKELSKQRLEMLKIKFLYCCGEVLTKNLVVDLKQYLPDLIIKNQYGPTEGCLFSFEFDLTQNSHLSSNIPVGKIVDNMKGYVLDANQMPLTIGAIGEIYIGGDGLARGYLNQPALTAEKFIANPFQNVEEKRKNINYRLYKTGDLGRWLPDGNLEYIGRNDFQVKVRGYRIELSEIEQALLSYTGITQAVVITHEIHTNTKWLVAYFVVKKGAQVIIEKLRHHLTKRLPEYMIPNVLMPLNNFPITQNGKLDRKALPIPELIKPNKNYIPPRNKIEKQLVNIWSKLLMLDEEIIGVDDNFFQLGGDSFTSMQMVSQARLKGININVKDIKSNPTIAQLALSLRQDNLSSYSQLNSLEDQSEYTLLLLPFHRNLPFSPLINSRLVKLKNGNLERDRLENALQKLMQRHSVLRTKVIWKDEQWLQKVQPYNSKSILKYVNLQEELNEHRDDIIAAYLKNSVQEIEETFTAILGIFFEWPNETFFLCVLSHHYFDVMSQMIFWQELDIAYQGGILPPVELSYREAVDKLHKLAERDRQEELLFWEKQLHNVKPLNLSSSSLKEEKLEDPYKISKANWLRMKPELDETLLPIKKILDVSKVNIHDLLLTAWVQVLCKYFKLPQVVVNIVIHGRGMDEDEIGDMGGIIGCFVSHYPISFTLPEGTGKLAVKRIRALIDKVPHKGMRYGILRYCRSDLSAFWGKLPMPYFFFHFQIATKEEEHTGIWHVLREQHFNELLMQGRLEPLWVLNPRTGKLSCSILFGQYYSTDVVEELWQQYIHQIQQLGNELLEASPVENNNHGNIYE